MNLVPKKVVLVTVVGVSGGGKKWLI